MARDWKDKAREGGGKYLKFKNGMQYDMEFIDGPREHAFTNEAGKDVTSMEWDVDVEGDEKILSVSSRRLLQLLADEDDDEELIGSVLRIKAIGDGFERQWRVKRIHATRASQKPLLSESEPVKEIAHSENEPRQKTNLRPVKKQADVEEEDDGPFQGRADDESDEEEDVEAEMIKKLKTNGKQRAAELAIIHKDDEEGDDREASGSESPTPRAKSGGRKRVAGGTPRERVVSSIDEMEEAVKGRKRDRTARQTGPYSTVDGDVQHKKRRVSKRSTRRDNDG